MKTLCNVVLDLIPLYLDEVCSEESKRIVDEHLSECETCRHRLASFKNNETAEGDFVPKLDALKKIRKSHIKKTVLMVLAAIIVLLLLVTSYAAYKYVFNIADVAWSDDGRSVFVVYDRAIGIDGQGRNFTLMEYTGLSGNRSESFFLQWFGGNNKSHSNVIFDGTYENGFWSPDGSKFVINVDNSSWDLCMLDLVHNDSRNIDLIIGGHISGKIKGNPEQFGYNILDESKITLKFLQWSEDSNAMLIYYKLIDTTGASQSGYCWYDYEKDTISSFMSNGL